MKKEVDVPHNPNRERRWSEEASFFDQAANRVSIGPVDRRVLERYASQRRRRFSKEFRFRVIGNLAGLRILDFGCGDGENAMTFAMLGAHVTGIDISPGAIDVCQRRAIANNVTDRTTFICAPIENADPGVGFDVLWGDAILHHVLEDMTPVLTRARQFIRPGGKFVFAEPVNLFRPLRELRKRVTTVPMSGTTDERPLQIEELRKFKEVFPEANFTYFRLLSRIDRLLLKSGPSAYESAGRGRKLAVNTVALVDSIALSLPGLRRLAGVVVLHGSLR